MSTFGRSLDTDTDTINLGVPPFIAGTQGLAVGFWFKLNPGWNDFTSGSSKLILGQPSNGTTQESWEAFYVQGSPNYIAFRFIANAGSGNIQRVYQTTADPFAGKDDGNWHHLLFDWTNVYFAFFVDGAPFTGITPAFVQSFAGNGLATTTQPLAIGGVLKGWAVSDIGFWTNFDSNDGSGNSGVLTSPSDYSVAANLAAGYPAEVVNATQISSRSVLSACLPITGANPELGAAGLPYALTGNLTGTSVIPGPSLKPPYAAVAATFNDLIPNTNVVHPGGQLKLKLSWKNNTPDTGPVTFTPTCPIGTFSPASIVLTTGASDTVTTTLTVPAGTANGPSTVSVANDGNLPPLSVPIVVQDAAVRLRPSSAAILPHGNLVYMEFEKIADGSDVAVTNAAPNVATITVNGGPPIPIDLPAYDGTHTFLWAPLNSQDIKAIDELDAACVLGGAGATWTGLTNDPSWSFAKIWYNEKLSYSDDKTATAAYTFTGLTPGQPYKAYVVMPWANAGYAPNAYGSGACPDAQYAVSDGGTTVKAYHFNQAISPVPYDKSDLGYRWSELPGGTFTSTSGTVTITLTNNAGSGRLYADAVRIEKVPNPIAKPGDTVVLNLPDPCVATSGGLAGAATNVTIPVLTMAQWAPYDPGLPRKMGIGKNVNQHQWDYPGCLFANRLLQSRGWQNISGGQTLDAHGNLTAVGAGGTSNVLISCNYPNNSVDNWQTIACTVDGTWKILYDAGANHPTVFLDGSGDGLAFTPASNNASGVQNFSTTVSTWTNKPIYEPAVSLSVTGDGTNVPTGLKVYDPDTPADWTKFTHPVQYNRLRGKGFSAIRYMDFLKTNSSNIRDYTDFHTLADFTIASYTRYVTRNISAIGPVDPAIASQYFPSGNGGAVIKITLDSTAGLNTYDIVGMSIDAPNPLVNSAGSNTTLNGEWVIAVIDATTIYANVFAESHPYALATLTAAYPATGTATLGVGYEQGGPEHVIAISNEILVNPWFCVPPNATDDCCHKIAQNFAANLDKSLRLKVEYGNEMWNTAGAFLQSYICMMHGVNEGGLTGIQWAARRLGQIAAIFRSEFAAAGRPNDVEIILGSQAYNAGTVTGQGAQQCFADGTKIDWLVIDTYQSNAPNSGDYNGAIAGPAYDRCSIGDLVDLCALHFLRTDRSGVSISHRNILDDPSYGGFFANTKLGSYEGGPSYLCYYGDGSRSTARSRAVILHPDFYQVHLAWLQQLERKYGFKDHNRFTHSSFGAFSYANWSDYYGAEADGTGTAGENPNPHCLMATPGIAATPIVSQVGAAYAAYAGPNPTPAPPPSTIQLQFNITVTVPANHTGPLSYTINV